MKGYEALKILDSGGFCAYGPNVLRKLDGKIAFCPIETFGTKLETWNDLPEKNLVANELFFDAFIPVKTILIVEGKWSLLGFIDSIMSGKIATYGGVEYKLTGAGLQCYNGGWKPANLKLAEMLSYYKE